MGISDIMNTGDVWAAIADLRRQLQNLTSGRRLEDASIGARGLRLLDGGSLTISGGSLLMNDETGSVGLVYFGDSTDFPGSRTWLFGFPNGEIAFGLLGSTGDGYWGGRDHAGNLVLSNDSLSGVGLGKPYLNYNLVPSSDAQIAGTSFWPSHTNTSFTKLLQGINTVWHPRVSVGVSTNTAGGGTAHWRLLINGEDVTGDVSGGAVRTVSIPGWGTDINPGDPVGFDIEAYIGGGGSRVYIQCDRLYGLQS